MNPLKISKLTLIGFFTLSLLFSVSCQKQRVVNRDALADSVKTEFLHAWNGYKKYAWGTDDFKPLSKQGHNWYAHSLLMTPVDAFDTMVLMGLSAEISEVKKLIFSRLSFDRDISVKAFEINIRLLGGLLSAYQLDGDQRFLNLARDLGNRLLPVFDSPTGLPYMFVNLKTGKTSGAVSNPAEIGTYIVEFGTLTRLTGDSVYFKKAKKALKELYVRRSALGLVGTTINVETGAWIDRSSHIGGMIDSYYEYLLKGALLFDDAELRQMWKTSVQSVNTHLADEVDGNLWYGRANMDSGKIQKTWFGALDAFFPAVLALDGQMNRARRLLDSCFKMWRLKGIEPELIDYKKTEILSPEYALRPEVIESTYYLFYFTGEHKYREMGRVYFKSLKKYCRTDEGYAALKSVVTKEKADRMESFFLAETLKYLYLLFEDPSKIDLKKTVFNTEAHPMFIKTGRTVQ
ncbi:MAG: glycoside hydrolase family 47 protein [Calditrichaeota bacterium]|nr:glycoside hydrolase family 47 protein [Calditrichota bacterium]